MKTFDTKQALESYCLNTLRARQMRWQVLTCECGYTTTKPAQIFDHCQTCKGTKDENWSQGKDSASQEQISAT